jgi:predicted amidophosphoribosyltransferase
MAKRNRRCIWHCGRETKNISRICESCWADREAIYQARKAREAATEKKPRTAKQKAATEKLIASRMAKLTKDLPTSAFIDTVNLRD